MSETTATVTPQKTGRTDGLWSVPTSHATPEVPWYNIRGPRRFAPDRRLRILHAPAIVTHQQWTVSRAQRALGHVSDVMAFSAQAGYPTTRCDIDLGFKRDSLSLHPSQWWHTLVCVWRFLRFFAWALCRYDVFHFHSESFLGSHGDWDLRLLRLFRKVVVFQYWGFDVKLQTPALLSERYGAVKRDIRFYANSRKLRDNLLHLRYADFRVYSGLEVLRNVPDALFIPIAIDVERWKPAAEIPLEHRLPPTSNVRILHPFQTWDTRGDWKGTSVVREAIDRLKAEGLPAELVFLDRVPNDAMPYYYQQVDIVIEQLLSGFHGNVSIEAMAMDKPVVCFLHDDAYKLLPPGNPIMNANPETLIDRLRELVTNPQLRQSLGARGRTYVETYYDSKEIAKVYLELYARQWR